MQSVEMVIGRELYLVEVHSNCITAVPKRYLGSVRERNSMIVLHKVIPNHPEDTSNCKLYDNNLVTQVCRKVFPKLKGARLLKRETDPYYDQDPYGNDVMRGNIDCQVWDLTEVYK